MDELISDTQPTQLTPVEKYLKGLGFHIHHEVYPSLNPNKGIKLSELIENFCKVKEETKDNPNQARLF